MANPALYRVTEKIMQLMQAERPDVHWFLNRSLGEPLQDGELPGCVIRAVDVAINPIQDGGTNRAYDHWIATLHFDCHSGAPVINTIDLENQKTITSIVKVIAGNRTLDSFVSKIDYTAMSGSEEHSYDTGCTVFEAKTFLSTAVGQFDVLIGQNGQPIP